MNLLSECGENKQLIEELMFGGSCLTPLHQCGPLPFVCKAHTLTRPTQNFDVVAPWKVKQINGSCKVSAQILCLAYVRIMLTIHACEHALTTCTHVQDAGLHRL